MLNLLVQYVTSRLSKVKDEHQPCCRVFTDKVVVTHLVMKFFGFMETECLSLCSQSQLMEPNLI